MSKLDSVITPPVLWPSFWGIPATAQSHKLVGRLLKLLPSLLWGFVAQPSLTLFYFQSHSLPTGLPRATKDYSTLLVSFSNWVKDFWSSSSWNKIPKMVGHFRLWKSTILQGPQPSFSQIITQLENTWEIYNPPQAAFMISYCLLKLRVLHGNTLKH